MTTSPLLSRPGGRRLTALVAAAALTALVATGPQAWAHPAASNRPLAATPTAAAASDFSSSFESGDPAPDWTNTAETDANGNKRMSGVTGTSSAGIPGSVMGQVAGITASGDNPPSETKDKLIDGDLNTKWLARSNTAWAQVELSEPIAVVDYALSSANDSPTRDPSVWTLQGSQDGQAFTDLDTQTGQSFPNRFQTKEYRFQNTQKYLYYRLNITVNSGDPYIQLSEWQLSNGDTTPRPPSDMKSFVSNGPVNGPNIKPNAGFTGLRALQYSGSHTASGRGYAYDKIFAVDVPVTASTQLSYLIFPELTGGDLNYPSTFAAVDLAFSDGTYLSDLGAKDQNLFGLSPQAQGLSKSLYADQWNFRLSRIGDVAAGKTVSRILIGYDNPGGPGLFNGWVDDIKIVGAPAADPPRALSDYVVTTRGTNASGSFSRGNNFPATAVPHGFNFWTPVTNATSISWLYDYQKANNADNLPTLQGFATSHEPSPWMGDRQTFDVMPAAGAGTPNASPSGRALAFKHENEIARAHYYSVLFQNGMRTEMTPTDHAAALRFTFTGDRSNIIFDNTGTNAGLTLDAVNGVVTGYSDVKSGLSAGATRMFIYGQVDKPVVASGMLSGGGAGPNGTGYFQFDTSAGKVVTLRVATSLLSVTQAKHNLELEISPTDTFDTVKARAQKLWDDKLHVIEVQGANLSQLTTLYSNLYRLFLYPNSGYENTATAEQPHYQYASPVSSGTGVNTPTTTGAKVVDGQIYVNNGFWDTYRTTWPAYALLTPSDAGRMIDGFVQQYRDGGWIARWSSPGYANLMTGTSSDVAFADSYAKGISNFDVQSAYDAALKNATVTPPQSPNDNVGRKGLGTSIFKGYTSTSTGEGVSWALEGYINDFGIANMSKALYDRTGPADPRHEEYLENYEYFLNRAQNYINLFDPAVGFFQGRNNDGSRRSAPKDYDPRVWGGDYTETDGWNFAFHAPQDGQGLANVYGGKDKLAAKLDQFFSTPETARFPGSYGGTIHEMLEARDVRMGQYGASNQVSHHILYMYDYAGQPYKTQAKVREALSRLYTGSEIGQGYPGDEDNGEMSAWQIFSALGFYPLQVGSPYYAIGSPLFTKATVHLENGKDLVINAPNNSPQNVYVQGLKLNGADYSKTYLAHPDLAQGGTLDFDMGSNPSQWGTGPEAAPRSITAGSAIPTPLADATDGATGIATGSPGTGAGNLFDDTSATQTTFAGPTPSVQYQFSGDPRRVSFYTITSGSGSTPNTSPTSATSLSAAGDPKSWVVKGSRDGATWTVLDERKDESFPWRLETRAFKIAIPGGYSYYRLEVTQNTGLPTTAIAELELLSGGLNPAPGAEIPESPYPVLLPLVGVALLGVGVGRRRRIRRARRSG